MSQEEEKADSVLPASDAIPIQARLAYTDLMAHHYRLRRALEADFVWFRDQMRLARESTRSDSIQIMNGIIEYLNKTIPELEKSRKQIERELHIEGRYDDLKEGVTGPPPDKMLSQ